LGALLPLDIFEGALIRVMGPFFASDKALTFATRKDAEAWNESVARQWCAEYFDGWSVVVDSN
jgi:hypothetical protein